MTIGKYEFMHVQAIKPFLDADGQIFRFRPQNKYNNKHDLKLHKYGDGEFCKFKLDNAENVSGVYAWVIHGESDPIYIGEANDLKRRFNMGYGNISPRNCFVGGQITNCKMNKVVLEYYDKGISIDIYFFKTDNYKAVELEPLREINTAYNNKNN